MAGKRLMARDGYERTSTAAIVREAGTSESQLMRYFGGKAGLLKAIFEENWNPLNANLQRLFDEPGDDVRQDLNQVLHIFVTALNRDPDLARLFLFEGRRMRGHRQEVTLSKGFMEFFQLFQALIERGQRQGTINSALNSKAVGSGLVGAAEGMVRDRMIFEELNDRPIFSEEDLHAVFTGLLAGLQAKSTPT
ncbi:MAG: TetR/AcrR family transcriptional regulator [Gammaproteobacteria bacterium]